MFVLFSRQLCCAVLFNGTLVNLAAFKDHDEVLVSVSNEIQVHVLKRIAINQD